METINQLFPWLELINRPAFCVKDGVVIAINSAAENRMLRIGMDVREIVTEHRGAYEEFQNGCLYLTITVGELPCNATVTRTKECDVFLINQDSDDEQLQALALAAQQLRIPLANVMTVTDRLFSGLDEADPAVQKQASQINHNLFQLLRIISNMSDARNYQNKQLSNMQTVDLTALFDEIAEKAQAMSETTGITISYHGLSTPVFGLANTEKLERAVFNLLSNALKFSPEGSEIDITLTKNGKQLSFTVCNTNSEIVNDQNFWNRYRREPFIEDDRFGLGLGTTLISGVASAHGGTVLVDHPGSTQTRVTMTIAINQDASGVVRSHQMGIGDYAGGRDKTLLEFAEILSSDAYEKIN